MVLCCLLVENWTLFVRSNVFRKSLKLMVSESFSSLIWMLKSPSIVWPPCQLTYSSRTSVKSLINWTMLVSGGL